MPKLSLSALQQRDCRQGLNLQEVYRILTCPRVILLVRNRGGLGRLRTEKVMTNRRPIALFEILSPREKGRETVMGVRQARI